MCIPGAMNMRVCAVLVFALCRVPSLAPAEEWTGSAAEYFARRRYKPELADQAAKAEWFTPRAQAMAAARRKCARDYGPDSRLQSACFDLEMALWDLRYPDSK